MKFPKRLAHNCSRQSLDCNFRSLLLLHRIYISLPGARAPGIIIDTCFLQHFADYGGLLVARPTLSGRAYLLRWRYVQADLREISMRLPRLDTMAVFGESHLPFHQKCDACFPNGELVSCTFLPKCVQLTALSAALERRPFYPLQLSSTNNTSIRPVLLDIFPIRHQSSLSWPLLCRGPPLESLLVIMESV